MQVHRLWWIPEGHPADDGAYVHYPADELLAVAAIVATRTGTVMVGEDLGTVPPTVVERLRDWGLPGMYEEIFTLHHHLHAGRPQSDGEPGGEPDDEPDGEPGLDPVPAGTWAGLRTHDMPAIARLVADHDVTPYLRHLANDLDRPVGADPRSLVAAMVERLRAGAALEVVVDLDDVLGVTEAHNVPGTVADTNWTRRLDIPAGDLAADDRLTAVLGPDGEVAR
jgi:4-alpha-glucanotransferase